jgi:hypothetical protein
MKNNPYLQDKNVRRIVENAKKQYVVRSRKVDAKNAKKVRKTAAFLRKQPFLL